MMPSISTSCSLCQWRLTYTTCITFKRMFQSSTSSFKVTLQNIFDAENKKRVIDEINISLGDESNVPQGASVLIPLCFVNKQPSLLFTLRSENMRRNRSQVSFPGGRIDPDDHDFIHTALREMREEIGIPEKRVDVWGRMKLGVSVSAKTKVVPVLGFIGEIDVDKLRPNQDEVEQVFTRSIASLCDPQNIRQTQFRTDIAPKSGLKKGFATPLYLGEEHNIWGLTAMFIHRTLTLIAPGIYNFKLRYVS